MSNIVGTIPIVNTEALPKTFYFNSKKASTKNPQLSSCQFNLSNPITCPTEDYIARIRVRSFNFMNKFYSILSGSNKLKVVSTWFDESTIKYFINTIEVPPQKYEITELLKIINPLINTAPAGDVTYKYGFGSYGEYVAATESTWNSLPFLNKDGEASILMESPTNHTAEYLSILVTSHRYVGFYLLYDKETAGLMDQLGLVSKDDNGNPNNVPLIPELINESTVNFYGIGFRYYYDSVAGAYKNFSTNTIISPDSYDLSGPRMLKIKMAGISTTIASGNSMNTSDVIAIIPVTNRFGYLNNDFYENPIEVYASQLQLSSADITIMDEMTDTFADFQGSHWILCIDVSFYETTNDYITEKAISGIKRPIMPALSHEINSLNKNYGKPHNEYQTIVLDKKKRKY